MVFSKSVGQALVADEEEANLHFLGWSVVPVTFFGSCSKFSN